MQTIKSSMREDGDEDVAAQATIHGVMSRKTHMESVATTGGSATAREGDAVAARSSEVRYAASTSCARSADQTDGARRSTTMPHRSEVAPAMSMWRVIQFSFNIIDHMFRSWLQDVDTKLKYKILVGASIYCWVIWLSKNDLDTSCIFNVIFHF